MVVKQSNMSPNTAHMVHVQSAETLLIASAHIQSRFYEANAPSTNAGIFTCIPSISYLTFLSNIPQHSILTSRDTYNPISQMAM